MAAQHPYSEAVFITTDMDHEREVRQDDDQSGTSSPSISDHLKESHITERAIVPTNGGERDPEDPNDGLFHQVIVKDGTEVLIMFTWMAIDRANVSGVLTSTFLEDTGITRDQANTGVSLLWLGIVLLEIPSNVIVWGLIEVLQCFVTGPGGWYAARLFLGLAESGFIPGALYTLSQWYTQDELTSRTSAFFFGSSVASAFGSLISSGALRLEGQQGILATGILAFALVPKSPYHTGNLFGGLVRVRGWLSEREADVFTARILYKDSNKKHTSSMKIGWKDITDVLLHWATWPYLIACLSGLQSINGLTTWGGTIIQSLGFTSITANLLNAPGPILAGLFGLVLSSFVDRYKRFGYAIIFSGLWTLAGLIALYSSWPFYGAYLVTQSSPGWQPINVTWLSLNFKSPQKRAIAYAVYSKTDSPSQNCVC
ncbi:hypothetical protein ACO1O0_006794 [Amphichorda felina]